MPIPTIADRTRRRVTKRLMPFLLVLYMVAFLDRVNISYAALEMTRDLKFSDKVFGTGAGIFFLGYFLLEIPGTMLVERWSARKWIARILISWGLVASLTGFITTAGQFYGARFVLGMAEAGFFPGVIVYLSHWYRYEDRGKAVAMFMSAIGVSQLLGGPISGLLMKIHWFGFAGWRWLLILEGLPAVLLGIATIFYLTDRPENAKWLPIDEREWLQQELARETQEKKAKRQFSVWQALHNRDVFLLMLAYFSLTSASYGLDFFLPKIVQRISTYGVAMIGLIAAIPHLGEIPGSLLVGWHSDKTGERRWHIALCMLLMGFSMLAVQFAGDGLWLPILAFTIGIMGLASARPIFWALPTTFLSESAAAASIGLINAIGNLGGYLGPFVMGSLKDWTGNYSAGFYYLMGTATLCSVFILLVRDGRRNHATQREDRKPAIPASS